MSVNVTLDRLIDARDLLAALVADDHYDFVPFFLRIENEIAAYQNQNKIVVRARAILKARRAAA